MKFSDVLKIIAFSFTFYFMIDYIYTCKTKGVSMKAFAWRRETNDSRANYCLQVENIKGKRALNKVVKILGDWEVIGDGYNAKTEEYTMIFSTNFDNPGKILSILNQNQNT